MPAADAGASRRTPRPRSFRTLNSFAMKLSLLRDALAASSLVALTACSGSGGSVAPSRTTLNVSFASQTVVPTGVALARISIPVDLDGDGTHDLVCQSTDGEIAVSLGQGGGAFAVGQSLAGPAGFGTLRVADVDGDLDRDLVAISALSGEATVFLNDGLASFSALSSFDVGEGVVDFVVVDWSGDGAVDLIVARTAQSVLERFDGAGDGSFGPATDLPVSARGDLVGGLAVGDFDGDSDDDVAFVDADLARVTFLFSGAIGSMSEGNVAIAGVPFRSAAVDLEGNGSDQLVVADIELNELAVVDPISLTIRETVPLAGQPVDVTVGDITQDGVVDLIAAIADLQSISISAGEPAAGGGVAFSGITRSKYVGGSPTTPFLVDLNGDDLRDVFVSSIGQDSADIFFAGSDGSLSGGDIVTVDGLDEVSVVAVGDFDLAGEFPLAVASTGTPGITMTDFEGSKARVISTPPVGLVRPVQLPGDGLTDLVAAVEGGLIVFRNTTAPTDSEPQFEMVGGGFVLTASGPLESVTADVNGDGVLDVAATAISEGRVAVALGRMAMGGLLEFEPAFDLAVPGGPAGIAVGDFDGDGSTEIVVSQVVSSRVSVLAVDGQALEAINEFPVAEGPTFFAVGNLDEDAADELVLAETTADQISVLTGIGGGEFLFDSFSAGDDPTALLLADLSNDGQLDLLITEFQGDQFQFLQGDADGGGFAAEMSFEGPSRVVTSALADVDGDGLADLIVGSQDAGGFGVFRNTSTPGEVLTGGN